MTETLQPDPLCPHGRPDWQACDDCLREIASLWEEPVEPDWHDWPDNPPQEDTPVPDPRDER